MAENFNQFTERARKSLLIAQEEAMRLNHTHVGTEHLLLGLITLRDSTAARVLGNLAVDLPTARKAVEFIVGHGGRRLGEEVGLTTGSKKAIEFAVNEARRARHGHIGTEHLLLGLLDESEGIASVATARPWFVGRYR